MVNKLDEKFYQNVCEKYFKSVGNEGIININNELHVVCYETDYNVQEKIDKGIINKDNYKDGLYDEYDDVYTNYEEIYNCMKDNIIEDIYSIGVASEDTWDFYLTPDELNKLGIDYENTYGVTVTAVWDTDYEDVRCNVELTKNEQKIGEVVASYDQKQLENQLGKDYCLQTEEEKISALTSLTFTDYESLVNMPRISECSKLLQSIFDDVRYSDATMCHITPEDWEDFYSDEYNKNDIDNLKNEVKKYGLDDVITFDDAEYMIVGWGDLETKFLDDRSYIKAKENDYEL